MTDDSGISSARRGGRRGLGSRVVAVAAVAVVTLVVVFELRRGEQPPPPMATAVPSATVTSPPPPWPTVTTTPTVQMQSEWITAVVQVASPTLPPLPTLTPRPPSRPTPPPPVSECVSARWTAHQSFDFGGQVVVQIRAVNRCGRKLEATELWFRVTGYRQGDLIQTTTGHAFNEVFPGRTENVTIGLPGSIDWYDRIVVEVMN